MKALPLPSEDENIKHFWLNLGFTIPETHQLDYSVCLLGLSISGTLLPSNGKIVKTSEEVKSYLLTIQN